MFLDANLKGLKNKRKICAKYTLILIELGTVKTKNRIKTKKFIQRI